MNEFLLEIKQLEVGIPKQNTWQHILSGVDFNLERAEIFSLLGESGSGKSMTSLAIMQLLPNAAKFLNQSEIIFNGIDLTTLSEADMQKIRGRKIAMIFQEPMTALNPVMTVADQISEVLKKHFNLNKKNCFARVISLLEEVGLPNPKLQAKSYPHQLSGGMKQRVMIAIALAGEPELLIADEATSALDVTLQMQILELLKKIQAHRKMTLLFITHDLSVAKLISDRIGIMYAGQLVEIAKANDFFAKPLHPYSQKLLESIPSIEKRQQTLAVIPGNIPKWESVKHQCRFSTRCSEVKDVCKNVIPKNLAIRTDHLVRCHIYDENYSHLFLENNHVEENIIHYSPTEKKASNTLLSLENVKIYYPITQGLLRRTIGYVKAVDDISFKIPIGKTVALVGESGCGKTSLAKAIMQLQPITAGEIQLDAWQMTPKHLISNKQYQQQVQVVFQDPFSSMNPRMLVGDIIAEGLPLLRNHWQKNEKQNLVMNLLEQVGLPADAYHRYPHEFSGGQRQRICVARALAVKPKLIICDEPTSALDVSVQAQVLNLLKDLQKQFNLSYLFITHNLAVVAYLADEIIVMRHGKIIEQGSAESLLKNPQHSYTKQLLGEQVSSFE